LGIQILNCDAQEGLERLADASVHCCVTSPPYWGLRDYGIPGQIGLEETPAQYIEAMMPVFDEVWRVLREDGTLWLNLGDSYIGYHGNREVTDVSPSDKPGYRENMRLSSVGADGLKNKDLAGIPWRMAFALQERGWYLRCDCIWAKPNPMPESVKDRPTRSHEYLFLLSKSPRYYYDAEAAREPIAALTYGAAQQSISSLRMRRFQPKEQLIPGQDRIQHREERDDRAYGIDGMRNMRSVRQVPTSRFEGAHFATFPPDLIRPCILAGCPEGGTVLDPFFGSGTVGLVCRQENRECIGVEINPEFVEIARERLTGDRKKSFRKTGRQCQASLPFLVEYLNASVAVRAATA